MGDPSNAASELLAKGVARLGDTNLVELLERRLSNDFLREDRRRLVGLPPADRDELLDIRRDSLEQGIEPPSVETDVLGVRGERLALIRALMTHPNGFESEMLVLGCYGKELELAERLILFDPEDVDAALAELDELHAEIDSADCGE